MYFRARLASVNGALYGVAEKNRSKSGFGYFVDASAGYDVEDQVPDGGVSLTFDYDTDGFSTAFFCTDILPPADTWVHAVTGERNNLRPEPV